MFPLSTVLKGFCFSPFLHWGNELKTYCLTLMGNKGTGKRQGEKSVGYLKYYIDKTWGERLLNLPLKSGNLFKIETEIQMNISKPKEQFSHHARTLLAS